MAQPFALPSSLKRLARALRDNPHSNRLITAALKKILGHFSDARRDVLIAHFPRVGRVSALMPNGRRLRMESPKPESIVNSVFYDGWSGQETEVLPLWQALAEHAAVIVDIGAHIGHFTLVAGLSNSRARIFSFEPLPRIASLLRKNVRLNRLTSVEVREHALGRQSGTAPFYVVRNGLPSSSSLSKGFMESADHDVVATFVHLSTLDAENLPRTGPVLMKIDTETTEPDVVAGGADYLRAAQPLIVIEVLDNADGPKRLMKELALVGFAFDPFLLTPNGPIARDAIIADPSWRNYLLVPKERDGLGCINDVLATFGINRNR